MKEGVGRPRGDTLMQRIAEGILVLTLILWVVAAEGNGQDKPSTPAEQYKTLRKEYDRASSSGVPLTDAERLKFVGRVYKHRNALALKFLELAEKNPKEPWTLDALTQVITQEYWLDNYSSHPGWGKDSRQARAIAILLRDHVRSDKLGETRPRVCSDIHVYWTFDGRSRMVKRP